MSHKEYIIEKIIELTPLEFFNSNYSKYGMLYIVVHTKKKETIMWNRQALSLLSLEKLILLRAEVISYENKLQYLKEHPIIYRIKKFLHMKID